MKSLHAMSAVLAALALTPVAHAVTVPSNVALAPQQDLTRQVPAEVESLDPAHIESWTGNTIGLDLFEGLARIDAAGRRAGRRAVVGAQVADDVDLQASP